VWFVTYLFDLSETVTMCQVEHVHSLARRSLATRQIVTGEYHPDDIPGGIWRHNATLDVCWFT